MHESCTRELRQKFVCLCTTLLCITYYTFIVALVCVKFYGTFIVFIVTKRLSYYASNILF